MDVELFLGQGAALQQPLEPLQLLGDVSRRSIHIPGTELEVTLHLGMDEVLNLRRMTDVGEALLAVLAAGFDQQVAGAENPFEHGLVEVDVVDSFERNLDATLADDPLAEDQPVGGDDEVGREPLHISNDEPDGRPHEEDEGHYSERLADVAVGFGQHDDAQDDAADQRPRRLGEVPPVRVHIQGDRFVGVQILLRERHRRDCSERDGRSTTTGATTGPYRVAMNADRLLVGLDADQRRAVESDAAPLAIVASAGSGKTMVLTRRIAHRIETGQAEPRHVVALTFTRDAAGELRRRLRRLDINESIEAGTFHSISLRLLRDRALTHNQSMPVLAPDRVRLVTECLKELRLELDPYPVMTDIDWARARRIEPADYERQSRAARRRGATPAGRFADVAAAYERLKKRRGVVDFDDLLDLNLRAVETDAAFRSLVHWRFRHFFVDEAQDLNPLQHALLEAWRGDRRDICLVGDPRQAIYGWNGSDHTTMTEVERFYPGVTVISLSTNYRCSPQVVSAGAAALVASGQVDDTASNRPDGSPLRIESYPTAEAEAAAITAFVRTALHQHNPSGIAVLARTNDQLVAIENALNDADIATQRAVGRSPLEKALSAAYRTTSREALALWADEQFTYHDPIRRRVAEEADRFLTSQEPGGFRSWVDARAPFDDLDIETDDGAVSLLTFHSAERERRRRRGGRRGRRSARPSCCSCPTSRACSMRRPADPSIAASRPPAAAQGGCSRSSRPARPRSPPASASCASVACGTLVTA